MTRRRWLPVFGLALITLLAVQTGDAWARASSGGSRGSRSYSAPARPAPMSPTTPTSPGRTTAPTPTSPGQRPGLFGGWGGMLGGLLLGGLLGGLLFGGFGGGLGISLLDLLVLGGIVLLVMTFLRRRRDVPQPAYAMGGGGSMPADSGQFPADRGGWSTSSTAVAAPEAPPANADLERGIGHIRAMDPRFDPAALAADARSTFLQIQQAVTARDVARLRDRLTPEMNSVLQSQCDRLRGARQTNRLERIDVRGAQVTEAWQESGQDYVTVWINASLLDYTVDDRTGSLVDGSNTTPQEIEEYWTFTRPVGPNPWRLGAIQNG